MIEEAVHKTDRFVDTYRLSPERNQVSDLPHIRPDPRLCRPPFRYSVALEDSAKASASRGSNCRARWRWTSTQRALTGSISRRYPCFEVTCPASSSTSIQACPP